MVRMFLVNALVTRSGQERRPAEGYVEVPHGITAEAHCRLELELGSDTLFSREGVRRRRLVRRFRALNEPTKSVRRTLITA